jgi:nitroimidazol reductase NimA-like FMN-containing flavoprotein (pyridoxamine 5'-phosphate oxidase superfamily)
MAKVDSAGFEVLDDDECYALLAGASLGRVGVSVGAMPAIFPVNFALVERCVVFCTGLGTKLTAALVGTVVAFEADWADESCRAAWSVLAVGRSAVVDPGSDLGAAALVAARAFSPVPRRFLVRIKPDHISGRRLPAP